MCKPNKHLFLLYLLKNVQKVSCNLKNLLYYIIKNVFVQHKSFNFRYFRVFRSFAWYGAQITQHAAPPPAADRNPFPTLFCATTARSAHKNRAKRRRRQTDVLRKKSFFRRTPLQKNYFVLYYDSIACTARLCIPVHGIRSKPF